jgi:hypothetical protein
MKRIDIKIYSRWAYSRVGASWRDEVRANLKKAVESHYKLPNFFTSPLGSELLRLGHWPILLSPIAQNGGWDFRTICEDEDDRD